MGLAGRRGDADLHRFVVTRPGAAAPCEHRAVTKQRRSNSVDETAGVGAAASAAAAAAAGATDGTLRLRSSDSSIGAHPRSYYKHFGLISLYRCLLGLTLCRKLVRCMEGDLVLEECLSDDARSTSFILTLPLRRAPVALHEQAGAADADAAIEPLRILYIDVRRLRGFLALADVIADNACVVLFAFSASGRRHESLCDAGTIASHAPSADHRVKRRRGVTRNGQPTV
jgi:hypothetical protein